MTLFEGKVFFFFFFFFFFFVPPSLDGGREEGGERGGGGREGERGKGEGELRSYSYIVTTLEVC